METGSPGDSFPQPIIRYSVLRYLQKRVAERCAALPVRFDSLEEWQVYRHRLIDALRESASIDDALEGACHLNRLDGLHEEVVDSVA